MTTYLLDTTTFSFLMREDPAVRGRLERLSTADRVLICAIVRGEILYGIERLPHGKRRLALESKAQQLFAAMPCEAVPATAADQYASLKRAAEQAGTSLDENDLWIAATARALGAVLVTADSDFSRFSAPTSEDWTSGEP